MTPQPPAVDQTAPTTDEPVPSPAVASTAAQPGQGRQTRTLWVTQSTAVTLDVTEVDLDAPGCRAAVERAAAEWLTAGGSDIEPSPNEVVRLEVCPEPGEWDLPTTVPVVAMPAGRGSGTGLVVTWEPRALSDHAALDWLSTYLCVDDHGQPRREWPGGADALDVLGEVLRATGRPT